jgi:hypothetical protein
MPVTHQLLTFNISLSAVPAQRTSLGTIALLGPDLVLSQGGGRYQEFTTYDAVVAAGATGQTLAMALAAFSQPRKPKLILVNVAVTASTESYLAAYTAFRALAVKHFAVCAASRVPADQLALAAYVETVNFRTGFVAQTDEDCTTWPAALSAIEGNVHSALVYSDADADGHDLAWITNRLTFNWDAVAPGMTGHIAGVEAPEGLDATDLAAITAANVNVLAPYGTSDTYMAEGVNAEGRPFDEVIAIYWFVDRLEARVQGVKLTRDAFGQKTPIDATGQAILENEIRAQFNLGVSSGAFAEDQIEIIFPSDLTDDLANREISVTVNIQEQRGAVKFSLNLNFTTTPVVAA